MKLLRIYFPLFALLFVCSFAACSDDDETTVDSTPTTTTTRSALIINQGNYYNGIDGTLDRLDLTSGSYALSVFAAANGGVSLGDSPQALVTYGSKTYVAMYGSNLVWVLDAATLTSLSSVTTPSPEGIAAADGYVIVSNNDGKVTRIDTTDYSTATLEVGPNPAACLAANGYVYVSISDGYNYANSYADGFLVVKLDVKSLSVVSTIQVGMNPGALETDAEGNVFVVCRGDYAEVLPEVMKISPSDEAAHFCYGSNIAAREDILYVIYNYTDYDTYLPELTYKSYDTSSGEVISATLFDEDNLPVSPIEIDAEPTSGGDLFVCSMSEAYGYNTSGLLYRYASDGTFVTSYTTGVYPVGVYF